MPNRVLVDRDVTVPMRDGTLLKASVYRPESDTPVPAILIRLPYGRNIFGFQRYATDSLRAAEAGFAVVYQDTRGRFQSEGEFYPHIHEATDGYDTVEWVAEQSWCSGNVGMTGASYYGATQWLAAMTQPPHLRAIFPFITPSEGYEGLFYQGGAFQLGLALLFALFMAPDTARRLAEEDRIDEEEIMELVLANDEMDSHYRHLPLATHPLLRESKSAPYYLDWLAHPSDDEYWRAIAINRHYSQIQVPAINVGGWYDLLLHGTLENYVRMKEEGGTEAARQGQGLIIGPWAHSADTGIFPSYSFGVRSSLDMVDLTGLQLKFFAHHLKGEATDVENEPPVRLFVMGENRWRDEQEWPLARTQYTPWYLHSDGHAKSEGGTLTPETPGQEPQDVYLYDPHDPTPTIGGPTFLPGFMIGANAGPSDQRPAESRADVLVYTSDPLERPVEVTGPLTVKLFAATSAPDTDFVARLCDVHPDGASRILAEGIIRARYRAGTDQARAIEPGRVYEYEINLVATSNVFKAGHRIRLDVTSSSFPRFDRNTNTGNPLGQDGHDDLRPALQTIFHDDAYPSHILLPVIPR